MTTFYKGFLIKQGRKMEVNSTPKFIATLQGVRFTAFTVTELHNKIDRNSAMIADMSNQGFRSQATIKSNMIDPSDYLLEAYEISAITASYLPREMSHDYA